jgi:putative inorganic carbon (HCO3(-)) transporter
MGVPVALAPILPSAGIVVTALAVAGVFALPGARARALAAAVALVLAPALLLGELWDNPQIATLRDRPAALAVAVVASLLVVGALAALFVRRPVALPLLAFAALPFRIPVEAGGESANLLVPLYGVVAAGVAAYAWVRLRGERGGWVREPSTPPRVELAIVAFVALYALQAGYSTDFEQAVKNVAFFYVPFALLLKLLTAVEWTRGLAVRCVGVTVGLALTFVAIGFWEFQARELLWNQKVIESNQFESYFRVNSLFFDPNIYGRYLALTMVALAAMMLWQRRSRDIALTALVLAVLWGGLVLTFSQSSFAALLVGLLVVACVRWRPWPILAAVGVAGVVGLAVVVAAPGVVGIDTGSANPLDKATSGRFELLRGGVEMWADRPLTGYGSGSFAERFRAREHASSLRAASASHTIPVTVAAEQGLIGLAAYAAVLWFAFRLLFERLRWTHRRGPPSLPPLGRTIVVAAFTALIFHTMTYAAFLEDPIAWALIGLGIAFRLTTSSEPPESPPEQARTASYSR